MAMTAFILIKTRGGDIVKDCARVCELPGVHYSVPTAGPYDILARWEGDDLGALPELAGKLRALGAAETLTLVAAGKACTC